VADEWQWMRLALADPLGQAGRFVTLSICCLLGPSFLRLLRFPICGGALTQQQETDDGRLASTTPLIEESTGANPMLNSANNLPN
jgi:hypothetical protein